MPTVLAQLHEDRTQASCPAAPGGIPLAMTGFAWLLYRVNDRYERSSGADAVGHLVSYGDLVLLL